jgi:predicted nucleic acid-binding protein
VVTILELRQGVVSLLNRDPPQAAIYQTWLRYVLEAGFSTRLLPVDVEVALRCAELHTRQPKSYRDSLIAATALVNNLTVVTRNVKDFAPMGVRVINPWE